jgi:hypothetical protein
MSHFRNSTLPSVLSLHLRTRPVERYTVDYLSKEKAVAQIPKRKAAKANKK